MYEILFSTQLTIAIYKIEIIRYYFISKYSNIDTGP